MREPPRRSYALSSYIARPPRGSQHFRRYGLCASHTKGKWPDMPHVLRLAPAECKERRLQASDPLQPSGTR